MFTWLRRNGSFSRTHSTPGITSTTSVGPGGVSQGYRSASAEDCVGCAFEFIGRNRYSVSYRLSGTRAAAPAEKADAGFGDTAWVNIGVIPGWSEGADPESRDSGFIAPRCPGMTTPLSLSRPDAGQEPVDLRPQRI